MRIAIDVGGTFTDVAWILDGRIFTGKVLTTYPDPSVGVFKTLDDIIKVPPGTSPHVLHASTLASNTAIERTGAATAVLTTRGFRDVLTVGRQKRYDIYDIGIRRPRSFVRRKHIVEVDERMRADGSAALALQERAVAEIASALVREGIEAVAVCFLNSYVNGAHEERARDLLRQNAPSLYVTTSADVAPQWREYERFSTTVLNAYLGPTLSRYLASLRQGLDARGLRGQLLVMQSSGGVAPADTMSRYPVRLLESGPAAGVLMAAKLASRVGVDHLLSFDMGGTTAKLGLVQGGVFNVTDTFEIGRVDLKPRSGFPVMIPSVDVIEIGAGGGSIARPARGLIEVGPRSAGADPGPACYGRGGAKPTVTDADLVLGYLNPAYFAGGSILLHEDAARRAITTELAEPLGIDVVQAAWSIHHLVNINMATAAKAASIARGIDVRDFTLLGFGGAGPVHAARIAEELGVRRVIIPPRAGVGSAVGLLEADTRFDLVRTTRRQLEPDAAETIRSVYADLEKTAQSLLRGAEDQGEQVYRRTADLRYVGQGFEVRTDIPAGAIDAAALLDIEEAFHKRYERIYGQANRGQPVEGTHWRVAAVRPNAATAHHDARRRDKGAAKMSSRAAYSPAERTFVPYPVFARYDLPAAAEIIGPAIIEEDDCTTIVPAGWTLSVDAHENLVLTFTR